MATFYTKEAGHVQWDLIDGTFDLPILAQLRAYLEDYAWIFPDERLYRRFVEAIKGLIAARVPIVAQIAAAVIRSHDPRRTFHVAKRYYRWLDNPRLDHRSLLKPAYAQTQQLFADQADEYQLVILDFSNLEKPYGYKFELLCTLKASGLRVGPRCRRGRVPGYNQLLALAVGQKKVGLTFAKTISYKTEDFVSLNRDIFRAIRYSRVILKGHKLRFVCDRGFDDEKTFAFVVNLDEEFIIRLYHNRLLQLRRGRALTERLLEEVVKGTRLRIRFTAWFKVRGRWRQCPVTLGYRKVWLPGHNHPYWLVVSNVYGMGQQWILLTNVPIQSVQQAKEIWFNYRRRWSVENAFRFLKKEGLRWEDFKVLGWEAIRRLVNLVLIAALFLLNIKYVLDETSLQLLLTLGGKLGLKSERDGPYLLLRGFQKLLACVNTLAVFKRYRQLDALRQLLDAL
jgi:hypothetical protein